MKSKGISNADQHAMLVTKGEHSHHKLIESAVLRKMFHIPPKDEKDESTMAPNNFKDGVVVPDSLVK